MDNISIALITLYKVVCQLSVKQLGSYRANVAYLLVSWHVRVLVSEEVASQIVNVYYRLLFIFPLFKNP